MNKRTPVPGYRLLPIPSTKLQRKDNHYYTPCTSCRKYRKIEKTIFFAIPPN